MPRPPPTLPLARAYKPTDGRLRTGVLVINGTTGPDISSLLGQAKANEERSKAIRQLLANDVGQGVRASITSSGASLGQIQLRRSSVPVTIRLSSRVPDFPVDVTGVTVRGTRGIVFSLTGLPRDISLGPRPGKSAARPAFMADAT